MGKHMRNGLIMAVIWNIMIMLFVGQSPEHIPQLLMHPKFLFKGLPGFFVLYTGLSWGIAGARVAYRKGKWV